MMKNHFEVTFPLILECDDSFTIMFTLQRGTSIEFEKGMYYFYGDNGSGKTTFFNMLGLIAGCIGEKAKNYKGTIKFNGKAYNAKDFNYIRAAEIREKSFCVFPQKVFFLPVSTRDNYTILNGSDEKKATLFSSQEHPDLLSGGQQQKILMDIILDEKKPVWFLDEPLTNMDPERCHYFWETMYSAYKKELSIVFFIDHWMDAEIKNDGNFQHCNTLRVFTENRQKNKPPDIEFRNIEIYQNDSPQDFFFKQIQKIEREKTLNKNIISPILLQGDWGVKREKEK